MRQSVTKRQVVFTVVLVLLSLQVFAQAKTDSIEYKRKWWGYAWIKYDGKELKKMREFRTIMEPDPIALGYLYKAKQKQKIDLIVDNSGLVCLIVAGISHSSHPKNNSFANNTAYLGGALIALSIPFTISANHNFRNAIKKYNSDLPKRL